MIFKSVPKNILINYKKLPSVIILSDDTDDAIKVIGIEVIDNDNVNVKLVDKKCAFFKRMRKVKRNNLVSIIFDTFVKDPEKVDDDDQCKIKLHYVINEKKYQFMITKPIHLIYQANDEQIVSAINEFNKNIKSLKQVLYPVPSPIPFAPGFPFLLGELNR